MLVYHPNTLHGLGPPLPRTDAVAIGKLVINRETVLCLLSCNTSSTRPFTHRLCRPCYLIKRQQKGHRSWSILAPCQFFKVSQKQVHKGASTLCEEEDHLCPFVPAAQN